MNYDEQLSQYVRDDILKFLTGIGWKSPLGTPTVSSVVFYSPSNTVTVDINSYCWHVWRHSLTRSTQIIEVISRGTTLLELQDELVLLRLQGIL